MVDALVPNVSVWAWTFVEGGIAAALMVKLMFAFAWNPVPVIVVSPRPAELNVTPCDRQVARVVLVEFHRQVVAVEQVDAAV